MKTMVVCGAALLGSMLLGCGADDGDGDTEVPCAFTVNGTVVAGRLTEQTFTAGEYALLCRENVGDSTRSLLVGFRSEVSARAAQTLSIVAGTTAPPEEHELIISYFPYIGDADTNNLFSASGLPGAAVVASAGDDFEVTLTGVVLESLPELGPTSATVAATLSFELGSIGR